MASCRIKMENYNGILFCETCMDDEFTLDDLEVIREEIRKNYSLTTDIICKKTGTYSVSADVQTTLCTGIDEFRNIVYVVDTDFKRSIAIHAAETYLDKYNVRVADTKEEAFNMLGESFAKLS